MTVHDFVQDYEFRFSGGGSHTPTDAERAMIEDAIEAFLSASPHPIARAGLDVGPDTYQERVGHWMQECFGAEISADKLERNDRFIEEALELVQSLGYDAARAHALVDYVFGRPIGDPAQEVGGVTVTLSALCNAAGLNIFACGENELSRITKPDVIAKIRAKQAAKPTGSALPIPSHPRPDAEIDPYAHADGSRECRPATGKWSRPDAEATPFADALKILEAHYYTPAELAAVADQSPTAARRPDRDRVARECNAPAERGAIVEECARLVERHASESLVTTTRRGQLSRAYDLAAAIRQLKGDTHE